MKARHKRARRQRRKANRRISAAYTRLVTKMQARPKGIRVIVGEAEQFAGRKET